jgi:hypothetical protein
LPYILEINCGQQERLPFVTLRLSKKLYLSWNDWARSYPNERGNLGKYFPRIKDQAARSPMAEEVPNALNGFGVWTHSVGIPFACMSPA